MDTGLKRDIEFQMARIEAIEAYASTETQLCFLFATWLQAPDDRAGFVFYKMGASARITVLKTLLKKEHGSQYDIFWHGQQGGEGLKKQTGLFSLISQIDNQRNQIIHWNAAHHWGRDNGDPRLAFDEVNVRYADANWVTSPGLRLRAFMLSYRSHGEN
jgi:hypothetical protein